MDSPEAVICPGGIGYDINCGVRMIRTNLYVDAISQEQLEALADELYRLIPVGVGGFGKIKFTIKDVRSILQEGMHVKLDGNTICWPEDCALVEANGKLDCLHVGAFNQKAVAIGSNQLGTLGSGNHYVEVQVVEQIFDEAAAEAMGIKRIGQLCISVHCGSRGLGHIVASEHIQAMESAESFASLNANDRQLGCVPMSSDLGQKYFDAMNGAANYAFVNRSLISMSIRKAFESVFNKPAREMDMFLIYDISHNIARAEVHSVEGVQKRLLVHRKGATRALPPTTKSCRLPTRRSGNLFLWADQWGRRGNAFHIF